MSRTRPDNPEAIRIEAENEWAWCGARRLDLAPRAFAVLRHLVEHAGRLITKEELLATVWRDAIVSDAALTSCIRDLRRALGRFVGCAAVHPDGAPARIPVHWPDCGADGGRRRGTGHARPSARRGPEPAVHSSCHRGLDLVGREAELARLHARLASAHRWAAAARVRDRRAGDRQDGAGRDVPGGDRSARDAARRPRTMRGAVRRRRSRTCQCSRRWDDGAASAGGERLVRDPQAARADLARAAAGAAERPGRWRRCSAGRRGRRASRMLRELVEALDALTATRRSCCSSKTCTGATRPPSTCSRMLARRREAARLLVLGDVPAGRRGGQRAST